MSWLNGQPCDGLPVHDRGLAYGDGLFETIRVVGGRVRLLERHLRRLEDGCQRLAIPVDTDQLHNELAQFCQALGQGVAKLIVTRGTGQRGYAPPQPCQPQRLLLGSPLPAYPSQHAESGIRIFSCETRLAEQPRLAGIKHLNRLEQVLARAEWHDPAFAEGLMRDISGRVVEGVFSNLFMVVGGELLTASLVRCGVAGVMRAEIMDRASQQGLAVIESDISYTELLQADEVFLCNSLYGIWPVTGLAERVWPVGPLTRKLQVVVADLLSDS
ncbi:aminodeoxychorismate lyase [Pseudomonas stutzeri]|uniref:Aminodeoxychorismate lyase n=1 Tax=Stutzerimonas stutzeri TaxID=316 RepID=A0A2N8S747_STUST|nr:aminodeoxychorismate lyase [Stutzerimonas stutzeri]MCQ4294755.1 aminodeoxychorismate lyase [Stutzerimonas stutzeri]PNF82443.1 aminodeoxychorismate lyase [Stutzerimonas stutzeri]